MIRPGYVTQVLTNYGADHDTSPLDLQNLIARKYDEQIKFKVDGPSSRFVTESVSSALFPHARVVKKLQNSYLLMFVFRLEKTRFFYQQCNTRQLENSRVSFKQCSFLQQRMSVAQ